VNNWKRQLQTPFFIILLGGRVEVAGLDGVTNLEIPEGTQTGSVFRIESKGIHHLKGPGKGDEYVIVKVLVPTDLSNKEKDLLREFARLREKPEGDDENGAV
jgi:molecular chaperone DnaJ